MNTFIIGIAGGSGSGKTTVAIALKKALGGKASILSLDSYQKFGRRLPLVQGIKNWDYPRSVDWKKFIADLRKLKKGQKIIFIHREQKTLKSPHRLIFPPNKILIIEGYLLFHYKTVRDLLDVLVFATASDKVRVRRRTKLKNNEYIRKILLPMHRKYIEPTKKYSDLILDTERLSLKQCVKLVREYLMSRKYIT